MATWPAQLPSVVTDGYALEPQASGVRTEMDQGPARQRQRFTVAPTHITARCTMTRVQFGIFEGWVRHRIADGNAGFNITLYFGVGPVLVNARFIEPFQAKPLGTNVVDVTLRLEVTDRPVMSSADLTALGV